MPQGSYGKIRVWDDFVGPDNDLSWGSGTVKVGNFGFVSVNEGSFEWTIDEPGGIVAITTDTGDNDNAALIAGTFKPSNGGVQLEARFKVASLTSAIYVGFTETLALATPVMPAEFATATMTYNGSGGMVGFQYDVDGTTDDFRAVGGDAGASAGTTRAADTVTNGIRANETITADEWYIARVEVHPDGNATLWMGHKGGLGGDLQLVAEYITAPITNSDLFYGVLMVENREGSAVVLEVDYMNVEGFRDWAVD